MVPRSWATHGLFIIHIQHMFPGNSQASVDIRMETLIIASLGKDMNSKY